MIKHCAAVLSSRCYLQCFSFTLNVYKFKANHVPYHWQKQNITQMIEEIIKQTKMISSVYGRTIKNISGNNYLLLIYYKNSNYITYLNKSTSLQILDDSI
eukprot:479265_1